MNNYEIFLDTSTIHGLPWISRTKNWSRLFWIIVLIGAFSGAGFLIYESFDNWGQSPVTTTIETLPISQITLPNVTICPPKNSLLNLNYDIVHSDELKLENDTRKELIDYSLDVVQEEFYNEVMRNLSKLEDPKRYFNWYHGYTQWRYPYYDFEANQLSFWVQTSATSGNLTTQFYGDKFDANKVDNSIAIRIRVFVPKNVLNRTNYKATLFFEVEKNTMKEVGDGDLLSVGGKDDIDADQTHVSVKFSKTNGGNFTTQLLRKIPEEVIRTIEQEKMPGFSFNWKYNKEVKPWAKYKDDNTQFTR